MAKVQTIKNKLGEVGFRKNLAPQFEGKKQVFKGQPSGDEYTEIVQGRISDYKKYFDNLKKKACLNFPYLEIGAGVGQGSMLLENKYSVSGFCSDISLDTLTLASDYKKKLGFKKMPVRLCLDAYNLPFASNSLPFVFCFQTLHHFPDPEPVLKEIERVLIPGGFFYFGEEPIAQVFNLNLWQRDRNLRWFEKILKALIILHFISRIGKSEIEHGILEETFTLSTWQKALEKFDKAEIDLNAFPFGPKSKQFKSENKNWLNPPFFKKIILDILGGGIDGLVQKKGEQKSSKQKDIFDFLACPECNDKPKLNFNKKTKNLNCLKCKTNYLSQNGIFLLFSKSKLKKLYPDL